jgi:hypothetical protein
MNPGSFRRPPYIVPGLDLGKAFVLALAFLALLYVWGR